MFGFMPNSNKKYLTVSIGKESSKKGEKGINQDLSIDAWDVIEKSCFVSVYLIS